MKVFKPSMVTRNNRFNCWNCEKEKDTTELASIPLIVKVGLIPMLLVTKPFELYAGQTCKQCEGQAKFFGTVGLILYVIIGLYLVFHSGI